VVVDANGIPLGTIAAPANRHDSPLLGETLDTLEMVGELPEQMSAHLDRGYDCKLIPQFVDFPPLLKGFPTTFHNVHHLVL
jgi:hypothetical protein